MMMQELLKTLLQLSAENNRLYFICNKISLSEYNENWYIIHSAISRIMELMAAEP